MASHRGTYQSLRAAGQRAGLLAVDLVAALDDGRDGDVTDLLRRLADEGAGLSHGTHTGGKRPSAALGVNRLHSSTHVQGPTHNMLKACCYAVPTSR